MAAKNRGNVYVPTSFREALELGRESVENFARHFLDVEANGPQKTWWAHKAKEGTWAAGARTGKTFGTAVKHLWRCFYQVRDKRWRHQTQTYITANLSISLEQSMLAWDIAVNTMQNSSKLAPFIVDLKNKPFPELVIGDGRKGKEGLRSELWARSTAKGGVYLFGTHFDYVSYDECALDPHGANVLGSVIRMRLTDRDGDLDKISTPKGKNWFYHDYQRALAAMERGDTFYHAQMNSSLENEYLPREALERRIQTMTDRQRLQEIDGSFLDFDSVFPAEYVAGIYTSFDPETETFSSVDYTLPVEPERRARYVLGVDPARKRDHTVIFVLRIDKSVPKEFGPFQIVFFKRFRKTHWDDINATIAEAARTYHVESLYIDTTGVGDAVGDARELRDLPVNCVNLGGGSNVVHGNAKERLVNVLITALGKKMIKGPFIKDLVDELNGYDWNDRRLSTDCVFALALAAQAAIAATTSSQSRLLNTPFAMTSQTTAMLDGRVIDGLMGDDVWGDEFKGYYVTESGHQLYLPQFVLKD